MVAPDYAFSGVSCVSATPDIQDEIENLDKFHSESGDPGH